MIRPGARAALSQWREALIGLAVLALGVYWGFFTGGGLLHWIGGQARCGQWQRIDR